MPEDRQLPPEVVLLSKILSDGRITAGEVSQLREMLLADHVIDRAEAELLFQVNRQLSGLDSDQAWIDLFVQAITQFVVFDLESPGEISQTEGDWLASQLSQPPSATEQHLLQEIKQRASSIAGELADRLFEFES